MKLLVIEDNASLLAMISAHLDERGFAVDTARTGADALARLKGTHYAAMILDLGLPDMDGMDVLREVRKHHMIPALILTARDGVANRIAGLDGGADDYILKPFDLAEFEARLRAVLRRPGLRDSPRQAFGDLALDVSARTLHAHTLSVELTPREATLSEALMGAAGRPVVRDLLTDRLFGLDGDVSGNALEAVVSRLRRKLAGLRSDVAVETVRGIGYRLRQGVIPSARDGDPS
jgi:two-component system response regulator QseB